MKQLYDFFPLVVFFIAYYITKDIFVATYAIIGASILQVTVSFIVYRKVEKLHLALLVILCVLGGLTLFLQDDRFVKWRPSITNTLIATVLLGSHFIGHKNIVQRMMEAAMKNANIVIEMTQTQWRNLNLAWAVFFLSMAGLNLYVLENFDEDFWVNFKVFGLMTLNLIFFIAQMPFLTKHMREVEDEETATETVNANTNDNAIDEGSQHTESKSDN